MMRMVRRMNALVLPNHEEHVAATMECLALMGFDPTEAETEASVTEWEAEQRRRHQTYLHPQLLPSAIQFVDTEDRLLEAASALDADGALDLDILGLDCEWDLCGGSYTPVSILQVRPQLVMHCQVARRASFMSGCCG